MGTSACQVFVYFLLTAMNPHGNVFEHKILTTGVIQMSNEMTKHMFGSEEVRTFTDKGEVWFIAKDISDVLGFRDTHEMTRILDSDEKGDTEVRTLGGKQVMTIINESGMYTCVIRSRKKEAKAFRKWVTGEVLPSIHKHGGYMSNQENMTVEEVMDKSKDFTKSVIEEKEKELELQGAIINFLKQKGDAYDSVIDRSDLYTMDDIVRLVNQYLVKDIPTFKVGRNKLFLYLKEKKILWQKKSTKSYYMSGRLKHRTDLHEVKIIDSYSNKFPDRQITLYKAKFAEYISDEIKKDMVLVCDKSFNNTNKQIKAMNAIRILMS